jgi:ankyrin repeat protein
MNTSNAAKRWIPRAIATITALAVLGWGASAAVANPYLQDHWLVEQIRAVVNVVAKLLPVNVSPTQNAPAVPGVPESFAVGNEPISQFDSTTRTFSFQDKIGSTRASVSGRWEIEAERLLIFLDRIDVDYASVGCKWSKCDAISHLQLRLQNMAGERQAADERWDWRSVALPVEPPIRLGERRRLAEISFAIPLLSGTTECGGAKGLARTSLPFLQPRIELGDVAKDSQQGMLPLGLLRGLPFASSTVPEGRKPPCAREPSVNEAITWGCPVELVGAVAVLSDAPKTTESYAINPINRKQYAPGQHTEWPPLFAAIVAADELAVAALIAAGVDVNLVTDDGGTPLASAVWRGSGAIVDMLINAEANVKLVINQNNGKRIRTALHSAAYESDAEMATLLINRGADPTARAETGWTPLALALAAPHGTALVKAMLKGSMDVNKPTPFANNAHWGGQPANALLIAITYNSHRTVRYLLSIGADPTQPGPWGFPVGHFASFYGFIETMDALRESGVDLLKPIVADRPHAGATYLMHAVHGGKMHSVDYMLKLGADPKQKDAQGKTAFDHALDYRHVAIAAKLKLLQ